MLPGAAGVTHGDEMVSLREALVALPVAGVLGAALAFRPQRRGTPPRQPAVIQTQIILALVGALVMLVVGASLARAFGIASCEIHTASPESGGSLPGLPTAEAEALRARLAARGEAQRAGL